MSYFSNITCNIVRNVAPCPCLYIFCYFLVVLVFHLSHAFVYSSIHLIFPFHLDPFAKVSLLVSGRQVKKTKTSIARKTLQPVYNEAFVFDIPVHRLSDVSLLVRVLHSEPQGEKDIDGKTMGKAIIGPDAKNSIGLHHWNCMMTSPRKPIAQWHPLMLS